MKCNIVKLVFIYFSIVSTFIQAQENLNIILRDKDFSRFQKVKLYLNILDKDGKPITKIDSSNFTIIENETSKQVVPKAENFYSSAEPMAILFTVDLSHSMDGAPLNNVKEGMLKIISEFRKEDKMGIAYFHDDFFKQASFDTDREVIKNNINSLKTGGSSSEIYKSVIESIKWLNSLPEPRRKVLVVISDGQDNGKQYKLEDVLSEVKNSGLTVFTIGSTAEKRNFLQNMESISGASADGKYYKITGPEDIKVIIPTLYERIKNEYIITYYSYAEPNTKVTSSLNLKLNDFTYKTDFDFMSPPEITEHAPSLSFWKTKEFLYGSIGAGALILLLAVFMFINISKKRQFKREKEEERRIREEESAENEEKFNKFRDEYDKLLDKLENQLTISESDKDVIARLEEQLVETGKGISGNAPVIDYKRRTMILEKGSSLPVESFSAAPVAYLVIRSGRNSGNRFTLGSGVSTIGRSNANLILNDDTVSRQHARVYLENGKFVIEDLSSTNGTYINGTRINRGIMNQNDIIRIGSIELSFTN